MRLNIDLTQGQPRKVLFTSDFHLFHENVLRFDSRPFTDVFEMQRVIEERWNEVVGSQDIVIYLGDLSFAKAKDKPLVELLLNRLNGEIHFVMGNHDKWDDIKKLTVFKSQQDYLEVRITEMVEGKRLERLFVCSHYPIYSWNKMHHGSFMVHGHSHMGLSQELFHKNNRIIDVGCMGYDYFPINHNEIIKLIGNIDYSISKNHH